MNFHQQQSCPPSKVGMYKRKTSSSQSFYLKGINTMNPSKMHGTWMYAMSFLLRSHARAPALKPCCSSRFFSTQKIALLKQHRSHHVSAKRLKLLFYTLKRCQETPIGFLLLTKDRLLENRTLEILFSQPLSKLAFEPFVCTQSVYLTLNTKTSASLMTDTSNSRSATFRLKIAQTLLYILTPSSHAA